MNKYEKMEAECLKDREISEVLIDEHLIYYCAEREDLESKFAKKMSRFNHITKMMPEGWAGWLLSQYVAFQLFKKGGYAQKYLFDPSFPYRNQEDLNFIKKYIKYPWKFCFCFIEDSPAPNFFNMLDSFTDDTYLVYSPSIEKISKSHPVTQYFMLMQYNGSCWETYGTIIDFQGITISDILFYARQLDPSVNDLEDIPELIERDPLPFAMLHAGSMVPLIYEKDSLLIFSRMEFILDSFIPEDHAEQFTIEKKKHLYRLSLKGMEGFPHFAAIYYNKNKQSMMLTAMTLEGFDELADYIELMGYELPYDALERVTPNMLNLTENILGYSISFFPYEKHFDSSEKKSGIPDEDNLNRFLEQCIQDINAGREPDIDGYAAQYGIDTETARNLVSGLLNRLNNLFH